MNDKRKRIDQLDYAKTVGIILIALGHIIACTPIFLEKYEPLRRYFYTFHVPLFFIINGIEEGLKLKTGISVETVSKAYVQKQFKRYIIPYLFWSCVYITIYLFTVTSVTERAVAVITARGIESLWFLSALFLGKLLFMQNFKYIKDKKDFKQLFLWLITYAVISIVLWLLYRKIYSYTESFKYHIFILYPVQTIFRIFPTVFFLIIGYWIGINYSIIQDSSRIIRAIIMCILCIFSVFLDRMIKNDANLHTYRFSNMPVFFLSGTVGSLYVILFCSLLPDRLRLLSFVGKRTMDIMVIHNPPIPIFTWVTSLLIMIKMEHSIFLSTLFVMLISLCASVIIIHPMRRLFEKMKKMQRVKNESLKR